jgi:hypothetical protein
MNLSPPGQTVWCCPLAYEGSAMPRYFFHVCDQNLLLDDEGVDLPDMATARAAAMQLMNEILEYAPAQRCRVEVSGSPAADGGAYFVVQFSPLQTR